MEPPHPPQFPPGRVFHKAPCFPWSTVSIPLFLRWNSNNSSIFSSQLLKMLLEWDIPLRSSLSSIPSPLSSFPWVWEQQLCGFIHIPGEQRELLLGADPKSAGKIPTFGMLQGSKQGSEWDKTPGIILAQSREHFPSFALTQQSCNVVSYKNIPE